MKVVIFLPNWIGDVAMATPALRALRSGLGPAAELVGVLRPYVADVLAGTSWLDRTLPFDPRSRNSEQRSWSLVRQLRRWKPDLAIFLTNSFRPACIAWLSGIPRRVGYARSGRSWLLTDAVAWQSAAEVRSAVDVYLRLVQHVDCSSIQPTLELATLPQDEAAADLVWQTLGLGAEPVVAMHAGGGWGGTATAKQWPLPHFAQLAQRIERELDHAVLILCGPNERASAAEVARLANRPRVVSLAEQPLGIGLSKACIRRSRLMVTTDSGPRHFAAAFEIPTVALFGPTDPRLSHNYHPAESQLVEPIPCHPCGQRFCPLTHHDCLQRLSVDRVMAAIRKLIQAGGSTVGL